MLRFYDEIAFKAFFRCGRYIYMPEGRKRIKTLKIGLIFNFSFCRQFGSTRVKAVWVTF